jgi:hypothetical protein
MAVRLFASGNASGRRTSTFPGAPERAGLPEVWIEKWWPIIKAANIKANRSFAMRQFCGGKSRLRVIRVISTMSAASPLLPRSLPNLHRGGRDCRRLMAILGVGTAAARLPTTAQSRV